MEQRRPVMHVNLVNNMELWDREAQNRGMAGDSQSRQDPLDLMLMPGYLLSLNFKLKPGGLGDCQNGALSYLGS